MITILTRGGHTPQEGSNITGPCSYKSHQFSLIFAKYFLSPKLHNICAENCIIMPIFRILHVLLVMQTFYTKRGLVAITMFLKLHYIFLKLYGQEKPIFTPIFGKYLDYCAEINSYTERGLVAVSMLPPL